MDTIVRRISIFCISSYIVCSNAREEERQGTEIKGHLGSRMATVRAPREGWLFLYPNNLELDISFRAVHYYLLGESETSEPGT